MRAPESITNDHIFSNILLFMEIRQGLYNCTFAHNTLVTAGEYWYPVIVFIKIHLSHREGKRGVHEYLNYLFMSFMA